MNQYSPSVALRGAKGSARRRIAGAGAAALFGLAALGFAQTAAHAQGTTPSTDHRAVPAKDSGPSPMHYQCGTSEGDKDGGAWNATGGGANQRSGSSTNCSIKGVAGSGDRLDYHCYTWGADGYTWTYLRNDTDGTSGWVRDDLLADHGSYVYCGR